MMPIPALDKKGLLPIGVHDCNWQEVQASFCWNPQRQALFQQCQAFMQQVWTPLGFRLPIWVDGSFTRNKATPQDIDLVVEADSVPDAAIAPIAMIWMQRDMYHAQYNVDFWFKHSMFPNDLCAFFQYTGTKAGAELQLDAKHPKGILRVLP
jgi:hypothetical protein